MDSSRSVWPRRRSCWWDCSRRFFSRRSPRLPSVAEGWAAGAPIGPARVGNIACPSKRAVLVSPHARRTPARRPSRLSGGQPPAPNPTPMVASIPPALTPSRCLLLVLATIFSTLGLYAQPGGDRHGPRARLQPRLPRICAQRRGAARGHQPSQFHRERRLVPVWQRPSRPGRHFRHVRGLHDLPGFIHRDRRPDGRARSQSRQLRRRRAQNLERRRRATPGFQRVERTRRQRQGHHGPAAQHGYHHLRLLRYFRRRDRRQRGRIPEISARRGSRLRRVRGPRPAPRRHGQPVCGRLVRRQPHGQCRREPRRRRVRGRQASRVFPSPPSSRSRSAAPPRRNPTPTRRPAPSI